MKRILAVLVTLSMLCSVLPILASGEAGIGFTDTVTYTMDRPFSKVPLTMEATILLPDSGDAYSLGGTIFGNYNKYTTVDSQTFGVYSAGRPRITFNDDNRHNETITFNNVNILSDQWTHLTLVMDPAVGQAYCYVNGELKETISDLELTTDVAIDAPSFLGGDPRENNANFFRGRIKNVTLYSDVRTPEEIAKDVTATIPDADHLLAAYVLTEEADIKDLSPNGYDLTYTALWVEEAPVTDYAYSFAIVGDTQYQALTYHDTLTGVYDWLVDNAKSQKMAFVFGMGDMTDTSTDPEWARVKKEVHRLDKVVPYSFVHGNHDTVESFVKAFPLSDYKGKVDGTYDGTMVNTYQTFTVSGQKYLVVNLGYQYTPVDKVATWANEVIAQHPDHQVIITTHSYLSGEGQRNEQGERLWDNIVSKHKNIVMVLCGHSDGDDIQMLQSVGEQGNVVTQFMINAQYTDIDYKGTGIIAMFYFSADGKNVQVRYYSTAKKAFFKNKNQFDFVVAPDSIKLDVRFVDIEGHWGRDYIVNLAEQGIIKGKTDLTFEPDANITRAEFLTLALNLAGIKTTRYSSFSDIPMSAWFAATIGTANKMGLIDPNMVKNDYFYPDQNITREEMTSIIVKLYESQKEAISAGDINQFSDSATFSDWTKESIGKAAALGVVTGNPDGSFNAVGNATRAEAAVIFSRLQKLL